MRCSVCRRWLGQRRFQLREDDATVSMTPKRWTLCADCKAAVDVEVARAGLESRARLRIAMGIVAAARPPRPSIWDDAYWENLGDQEVNRLLVWIFAVAFVVHAVAFLAVAVYIAVVH